MFFVSKPWRNWAKTEQSAPAAQISPRHTEHVVQAVHRARETGHSIKPVGAAHSFTGVAATDGIQVEFERLRGLVSADLDSKRVTLWAGTHLWELPIILGPLGLALENMGDIDKQTISGATQTGTHGTGITLGGLSTAVVGVTMVSGEGNLITVTDDDPELLSAVALGLGALGIIVTITIQCVPAYLLLAEERPASFESVLDSFVETARSVDHFEFFWFPHTKSVRTKANTRLALEHGAAPLTKFSRFIDEEVVNNLMLGALVEMQHFVPGITPAINLMIESVSSRRTYTDLSHNVFITKRRVRFREAEYAVPVAAVPEVVREVASLIERKRLHISYPVEVRTAAADSLMLSTAHEREVGYIAVHRYIRDDYREYFAGVESIMREHGARPHWGKMHSFDAEYLSRVYPNFEQFLQIRNDLDPDRVFRNDYLTRVLGE